MARVVIKRRRPTVVGITGFVGRSLTKEAVSLILSQKHSVRETKKEHTGEIDILLAIIGVSGTRASFVSMIGIFFRWLAVIMFSARYPDILVFELDVSRLGDMERLLRLIAPKIGVITDVLPDDYKEQLRLIASLPENGFAILNADDKRAIKMSKKTRAKVITYGFNENALLLADNPVLYNEIKNERGNGEAEGFSFKLNYDGKTIPVRLPEMAAVHHIEPMLAAIAVGITLKMNLVEIVSILET